MRSAAVTYRGSELSVPAQQIPCASTVGEEAGQISLDFTEFHQMSLKAEHEEFGTATLSQSGMPWQVPLPLPV